MSIRTAFEHFFGCKIEVSIITCGVEVEYILAILSRLSKLHKIGSRVLSVISLSLGLDKDYFSPWIDKGNSLLRSIHYPPVQGNTNPHRARAHTDINLITLLIGAEEGGLEVLNKDGSWIKVEPSSNAIVCNIGDMMQLVTDKHLVSTTHRVIQDLEQESKARYSIPFFLHPAPSITLKSVFRENDDGILETTVRIRDQ